MTAYLVCWVDVRDLETYSKYTAQTPGIIAQYGGRFLVRGGEIQILEGEAFEGRLIIVEFPSVAAANRFYNSPEYQAAKAIREPASTARFVVATGVQGPR
jgi:uncharacterized protein (DUF1330 family)